MIDLFAVTLVDDTGFNGLSTSKVSFFPSLDLGGLLFVLVLLLVITFVFFRGGHV